MDFNNKHVVLIILVIIFFVFVYNYDVYVIKKGDSLCKPIYVIKRELEPEILKELNESEKIVINEAFETDYFGNINMDESSENYQLPPKSLLSFHVPEVTDPNKISIMDSVIKVLSYIPTNIKENEIKEMLEYFGLIYQTSSSLEDFYKNVSSSTKIKSSPYNTKYSQLILFLIGKFNNDYSFFKSKCNTENLIGPETSFNPNKNVTQQYLNTTTSCENAENNLEGQQENQLENELESQLEDNVISEIENELDSKLGNNLSKNKKKIRFSEDEQTSGEFIKSKSKKGKTGKLNNNSIKNLNSNEKRPKLRQYSNNEGEYDQEDNNMTPENNIFKKNKQKNDPNNNCNCTYKCDADETFNNIGSLDSYNTVSYESFASF